MDAYEVTVARFREFWDAGRPSPSGPITYPGGVSVAFGGSVAQPTTTASNAECNWSGTAAAREAHPINCLDFWTAFAFCAWDGGRLPTEAERELAARGWAVGGLAAGRSYPWGETTPVGNTIDACVQCQAFSCVGEDGARTRRVGSFPASGGLHDLAGNVAEWAVDLFEFYGAGTCWPGADTPQTDPLCSPVPTPSLRVTRGGNWGSAGAALRGASRIGSTPSLATSRVGLRCVRGP